MEAAVRKSHDSDISFLDFELQDSAHQKEVIFNRFKCGKALAKMLISDDDVVNYDRFDQELSELKCRKVIQAASTTLLIPTKAVNLFRDFGFILDSDYCKFRDAYDEDAGSYRIDDDNNTITWSVKKKCFVKGHKNPNGENATQYSGNYIIGSPTGIVKFNNIRELQECSKNQQLCLDGSTPMNEVIVDYEERSIIGLVVTRKMINREDFSTFGKNIQARLGAQLPIFQYSEGALISAEDTTKRLFSKMEETSSDRLPGRARKHSLEDSDTSVSKRKKA